MKILTKQEIDHLLKTNPELVGTKLLSYKQRISILLEMLNEINEKMLQVRIKELAEEERV